MSSEEDNDEADHVAYYEVSFCGGNAEDVTACTNDFGAAVNSARRFTSRSVEVEATSSICKLKFTISAGAPGAAASRSQLKTGDKYIFKVRAYNELDFMSTADKTCAGPASLPTAPSACTGTTGITAPAQ